MEAGDSRALLDVGNDCTEGGSSQARYQKQDALPEPETLFARSPFLGHLPMLLAKNRLDIVETVLAAKESGLAGSRSLRIQSVFYKGLSIAV